MSRLKWPRLLLGIGSVFGVAAAALVLRNLWSGPTLGRPADLMMENSGPAKLLDGAPGTGLSESTVLEPPESADSALRIPLQLPAAALDGPQAPQSSADEYRAMRLDALQRLHSTFVEASARHGWDEFQAARQLLQNAIIVIMDARAEYTEKPAGEAFQFGKSIEGERHIVSGRRDYVVDLSRYPVLAQIYSAVDMDIATLQLPPKARAQRMLDRENSLVLSGDQLGEINRVYTLALEDLTASR